MKKSEIMKQYDTNASTMFIAASIALVVNSLLTGFGNLTSLNSALNYIVSFLSVIFIVFAYVMTIKGFLSVNKACKLSEENENYYSGKNLMVFSVISLILTVIFGIAALVFRIILLQYQGSASALTDGERLAMGNVAVITAIVLIVSELVSIAMPYIFYLWKIHKFTPKAESINNFALLTMIVMILQLAIRILDICYSLKVSSNQFLSGFSSFLLTIKYIVLLLFFITRRKGLMSATDSTPTVVEDTDVFVEQEENYNSVESENTDADLK